MKDEEWLDSRFMWKEELTGFVPGLSVEHEEDRNQGLLKTFDLRSEYMDAAIC